MSKWDLLKAQLGGKRDNTSQASIHRFHGFEIFLKKKVIWQGFVFHREIERREGCTVENALNACVECCMACLIEADCAEVKIYLKLRNEVHSRVVQFISQAERFKEDDERELSFEIEKGVDSFISEEPRDYTLLLNVKGVRSSSPLQSAVHSGCMRSPRACVASGAGVLYTREKPQHEGVKAEGILSNKLHGIDNTGNVCVWASESVLLHTILNSEVLREAVRGKRVLELSGGMTALCGLGLAVAGECHSVILTDGHPDCVNNQRVMSADDASTSSR